MITYYVLNFSQGFLSRVDPFMYGHVAFSDRKLANDFIKVLNSHKYSYELLEVCVDRNSSSRKVLKKKNRRLANAQT